MTDKPFHCNSCYKCFAQQSELDAHRQEHGRSRLLRTHICKYCKKGYVQIAYLEKHLAKHEAEERSNSSGNNSTQNTQGSSPNGYVNSQRPNSSLSSTPTTSTSVVPGHSIQSPDYPQNSLPQHNNNQINFFPPSTPLGLPAAQEMVSY